MTRPEDWSSAEGIGSVTGKLWQLADGSYGGPPGRSVDPGTAEQIIEAWETGDIAPWEQPLSEYQQWQQGIQEQQLAQQQAQFEAQRATERERYLAN